MKVLVLCIAVLLASNGVQSSSFLDSLKGVLTTVGNSFKATFDTLKQPLAQLGSQLLDTVKTAGTQLLSQGAATLLGSLQNVGQPATRDIAALGQFLEQGKTMLHTLAEEAKSLFGGALSKLTEVAHEMSSLDFLSTGLKDIFAKIDGVTGLHDILQGGLVKSIGERLMKVAGDALGGLLSGHKRSAVLDTLTSVAGQLASTFKPLTDQVTQHVQTLGNTLKTLGTNLLSSLSGTFNQLKDKLSTHLSSLKDAGTQLLQHGTNALTAAQQALTDILGQTFKNAQPALSGVVETLKDATGVVANHLAGN